MASNPHLRLLLSIVILVLITTPRTTPAEAQTPKPKLALAADGWPSGPATPEGAASDMVRALIQKDEKLFRETCVRPFAAGNSAQQYEKFKRETVAAMRAEAARAIPSPGAPVAIEKVFAARHLTLDGPASYGDASFGFQDVMFVDIVIQLPAGAKSLMRNLVIHDKDGKWYVDPLPSASPLLSTGLENEAASKLTLADAYLLQK